MNPPSRSRRSVLPLPSPGRAFRLTYSNVPPGDDPELFKCRDGIAFSELFAPLVEAGTSYGTTIFLYPHDTRRLNAFPAFQPADVLVMTTRPPLDDLEGVIAPHRKKIWPTRTELEEILVRELGRYFSYCTRKHVELTEEGAQQLLPEHRNMWTHVEVYEYLGAKLQRHYAPAPVKPKAGHISTIAFFLRVNRVAGLGCDFVASFGMDGYGTLIWNRLIRTRYPHWLASPGFIMAELIYKKPMPPDPRPLTPEFADDESFVDVRVLTAHGGGTAEGGTEHGSSRPASAGSRRRKLGGAPAAGGGLSV